MKTQIKKIEWTAPQQGRKFPGTIDGMQVGWVSPIPESTEFAFDVFPQFANRFDISLGCTTAQTIEEAKARLQVVAHRAISEFFDRFIEPVPYDVTFIVESPVTPEKLSGMADIIRRNETPE